MSRPAAPDHERCSGSGDDQAEGGQSADRGVCPLESVVADLHHDRSRLALMRLAAGGNRAGRAFADRLRDATGARGPLPAYAISAAQAAEALLDAIARSDGTRPSVAAALRRTDIRSGLLGDVRFDARGDPLNRPFTVFRLDFSRPPMRWGDVLLDARVDRIVVATASR